MKATQFSEIAHELNRACRSRGLKPPTFRTPPPKPVDRSLRLYGNGSALVSVRIAERTAAEVRHDMVEGVIAANRLDPESASRIRKELLVADDGNAVSAA